MKGAKKYPIIPEILEKSVDICFLLPYILERKGVMAEMKLEKYLERKKIALGEFSEKSGVNYKYLVDIKNGRQPASRNAIVAIHKATRGKVTFKDLVDLEENKEVVA